jgi:hypothetical protein
MVRLGGLAAAFALTAGLAVDAGGYAEVSYDRGLVGTAAFALVLAILAGTVAVSRASLLLAAALVALTAWTAASWLWSESPPRALVEAPRAALYLAVAAAVVVAGRRVPLRAYAGGIVAACVFVAVWNLVVRVHGVARPDDTGALDRPVGYANGVAFLCVLGLLLLPALPRLAWIAVAPLAADLAIQGSTGSLAALAAGVVVYAAVARPSLRRAALVVAIAGVVVTPLLFRGHDRGHYWSAAVAEAHGDPVLGSGAGTYVNAWLRERDVPLSTREAHSLYLETLGELGPLGLALVLAVLAIPLATAVRARAPVPAAALGAYAVAAAVDFHWELAGVTAPVVVIAASVTVGGRVMRVPRRSVTAGLACLTAASVLAWAGASKLAEARDALRSGEASRAVAAAHDALRFAPYSADAWAVIGDAERSADAYHRALALDPSDWSLWLRLARVTSGEPRRLALREAARLNPLGVPNG